MLPLRAFGAIPTIGVLVAAIPAIESATGVDRAVTVTVAAFLIVAAGRAAIRAAGAMGTALLAFGALAFAIGLGGYFQ